MASAWAKGTGEGEEKAVLRITYWSGSTQLGAALNFYCSKIRKKG